MVTIGDPKRTRMDMLKGHMKFQGYDKDVQIHRRR